MTSSINIGQLLDELAADPQRRAVFTELELHGLANVVAGLRAVATERPKPSLPAPRADGATYSGDRPVGAAPWA